jgi:hypothetical protein
MKTAMQELIERLERNIKEMPNEVNKFTQGYKAGLNFVIECATTSLEKEKEQIIEAHTNAYLIGEDYIKVEYANKESEHYYNQTYNQNK